MTPIDRHIVSVIIPTLGRDTLALCQDALAKQTRQPDEVIVVLDRERRGIAWGRNEGIARAKGDLIAFADDDGIPPPDWLERLVGALDRHDAAAAGGTFQETRCWTPFVVAPCFRRSSRSIREAWWAIAETSSLYGIG